MISDGGQHGEEVVVSIRQRKNTESVEDVVCFWDGRKKPIEVFFVDALREESNNSKEVTCMGTKALKCRRSEG